MAKKNKSIVVYGLALVIIIILVLILFKDSVFPSVISPVTDEVVLDKLEGNEILSGCSIQFTKTTYNIGEEITMTIIDGANQGCDIYVNPEDTGWTFFNSVVTGANGRVTGSGSVDFPGSVLVRVICGDCTTNTKLITVVDPTPDCVDADGGIDYFVKSTCTDSDSSDTDRCPLGDFTDPIEESFCSGDGSGCLGVGQLCSSFNAFCYQGECVLNADDSDGDGFSNEDEIEAGTDPFDDGDFIVPFETTADIDCSLYCIATGRSSGACGIPLEPLPPFPCVTFEGHHGISAIAFPYDDACSVQYGAAICCCI